MFMCLCVYIHINVIIMIIIIIIIEQIAFLYVYLHQREKVCSLFSMVGSRVRKHKKLLERKKRHQMGFTFSLNRDIVVTIENSNSYNNGNFV